MTLVTLTDVLGAAEQGGYAVGAFNVSDLNQAVAVLDAAVAERSPVIVQAIAGMSPYDDERRWWKQLRRVVEDYSDVTAALHLDHGRVYDDCARAIECGFTSVMIDASRTEDDEPADFESNVALTTRVVDLAHPAGVSVEGELGTVGGAEGGGIAEVRDDIVYADPEQAEEFVSRTGVDALAVAVGTSHGSVKFTDEAALAGLRFELIEEIHRRLPGTFLVLHGSSSVPSDAVATINEFGGAVTPSRGIDTAQKQGAISHGIRKINQGTDSHLAWTAALRKRLSGSPAEVEPSLAIFDAMSGFEDIVRLRMREFSSAGQS